MDDIDFVIPCADYTQSNESLKHVRTVFETSMEFRDKNELPLPDITAEDKREALAIFHNAPSAPTKPTTSGAALALSRMLSKYDYVLDDPVAKMRNYVMFKLFDLAEHDDPKISMRALENLAKTADIGLFSERVEININQKTTVDLEKDLAKLIQSALKRPGITTEGATDAEFTRVE